MTTTVIKPNTFLFFFMLFGGCLFAWPTVLFFPDAFLTRQYLQIVPLFMCMFFGLFSFACFWCAYIQGRLEFTETVITKYSIVGTVIKTVRIADIIKWEETENAKGIKTLKIFTTDKKFEITTYENGYEELKSKLVAADAKHDFNRDKSVEGRKRQLRTGKRVTNVLVIILVFFSYACLSSGLGSYFQPGGKFSDLKLVEIAGTTISSPDVHIGSKSSKWVEILLREYPMHKFRISGMGFYATALNDLKQIKAGDSVFLSISKVEYDKRISKSVPLSFFDKTVDNGTISIYELSDSGYYYLDRESYRRAQIADDKWGLVIAFVGVVLLSVASWVFYKVNYKGEL